MGSCSRPIVMSIWGLKPTRRRDNIGNQAAGAEMISLTLILLAAANSPAAGAPEKLHPIEAYCVTYSLDGPFSQTGWLKVCSRNFGAEITTITYAEGEGGNFKTNEKWPTVCHSQTILIGPKQYVFDLNGKKGALLKDPTFDLRVKAANAYFVNNSVADYLEVFGFTPTGLASEIEGIACDEYENKASAEKACYTNNLLLLRSEHLAFAKSKMQATKVAVGESGDDAQYRLFETLPYVDLKENGRFTFACARKDEIEEQRGD